MLRLYLTKEGYQVTVANDGEEGLEKFNQVKPDMVPVSYTHLAERKDAGAVAADEIAPAGLQLPPAALQQLGKARCV